MSETSPETREISPETNALRRIRKERGLTQAELAEMAGTSQAQIDRLEKDGLPGAARRKLTKNWALRLAPVLSCNWDELMGATFPSHLSERELALLRHFRAASPDLQDALCSMARCAASQQPTLDAFVSHSAADRTLVVIEAKPGKRR